MNPARPLADSDGGDNGVRSTVDNSNVAGALITDKESKGGWFGGSNRGDEEAQEKKDEKTAHCEASHLSPAIERVAPSDVRREVLHRAAKHFCVASSAENVENGDARLISTFQQIILLHDDSSR